MDSQRAETQRGDEDASGPAVQEIAALRLALAERDAEIAALQDRLAESRDRSEEPLRTQSELLESITAGTSLGEILGRLCLDGERHIPGSRLAILLYEGGGGLRLAAAPSAGRELALVLDGLVSDLCPACADRGSRRPACLEEALIVADTAAATPCPALEELRRQHGVAAFWSVPIHCAAGLLGALFVLRTVPGEPSDADLGMLPATAQLVRIAAELLRADEQLRLIQHSVDRAAEMILWIDVNARVFSANAAASQSLGYSPEELLGRSLLEIDPRISRESWPRFWEHTKRAGQALWRTAYQCRDGSEMPAEVTASFLRFGDREYLLAMVRDIGDQVRAEQERRRFEAQMQHSQKLESLGVLAGGIAHDFNNYLQGILGNTGLAQLVLPEDDRCRTLLQEADKAAHRAADLVRQMLAYSGKGKFVLSRFGLNEVVRDMTELLRASVSKKADLRLELAEESPRVDGDATQLRQVLMNLITNASDALGQEGGEVILSTGSERIGRAELAAADVDEDLPEGRYAWFEVRDDGCGMDAETRHRIFDPFFTTKTNGRGLGMAAVLGIVRGHRGTIRVTSEPGRGSTFRVFLPVCLPEILVEERDETAQPADDWRGEGTVLVVDDQEMIRLIAGRTLEQRGFDVVHAEDGMRALEVFRQHAEKIVAVLLDISMPRLDGVETFYELRNLRPDLNVVLSSGYGQQEVLPGLDDEHAGYIQKPYKPQDLVRVVRDVLAGDGAA